MPLNLNANKLVIAIKPDYQPVSITGYTPTVIVGSGGTSVSMSGQTFVVYSPADVLPTVLIGSGDTSTTNISGNTWVIYSSGGTSTGTTGNYVFSGITPTEVTTTTSGTTTYISIYSPSGATGPQGIQGVSGATGPQGPQGISGATGPQGIQGISGDTPTLDFQGSGSTVVNYSQTGSSYTVNIYAPSGATGPQGPQGIQGVSGATGPQGVSGNTVINYYDFIESGATTIVTGGTNQVTIYTPIIDISGKLDISTFTGYTGTTAPATYKAYNQSIVSLTGNTTINATHSNKILECNGTFTVTLPNSMATGMNVDIVNVGSGIITVEATTLVSKDSKVTLANQYGGGSVYHRGSNVWLLVGDLT